MFKQSTPSSSRSTAIAGNNRSGWVKVTLGALVLALAGGSLAYWKISSAKKDEKKPNAEKIFEFASNDIALLGPRNMGLVIPISGSLRPVTQAMVKSKVSGEVAQVRVREGEHVTAGQVLVSIDTADLKARHDSQMAMVAESRAKLDLAKKNEESNRQLLSKNFISQTAFDSVANSAQVSEANYKSMVAQAAITERALADAQIRAPFAGIVAKRVVNIGEKVTADAPVIHVVDLNRMELEAPVPVSDIPSVKVGQEIAFKVDGFADRVFKGKVERVNPAAEAGSRSISIFVTLANADGALKGGMFANGTLAAASRSAVNAVPIAAVINEGGQSFVFAVSNGKAERKPITPGSQSVELGLIEVRDGLPAGAQVIAVKADGLKHGSSVVVRDTGSAAPSAPAALPPPASSQATSTASAGK
ncbi:MAG: efflux RND transporter periplasmic adaptor subunit [Betaproteobacteria bacterium]|nr:efflux RND transporter periplasmic adaptor subunit [Betaproteobacteria bacterium]